MLLTGCSMFLYARIVAYHSLDYELIYSHRDSILSFSLKFRFENNKESKSKSSISTSFIVSIETEWYKCLITIINGLLEMIYMKQCYFFSFHTLIKVGSLYLRSF